MSADKHPSWARRLRPRGPWPIARRMHRDEQGATLTEFIVGLPIFFLIFAGIMHLGELSMAAVRVQARGYAMTFDELEDYRHLKVSDLVNFQSASMGERQGSVLLPATAAESAMRQMVEHPPRVENAAMRAMLTAAEGQVFAFSAQGSLPANGHLGEIAGRTRLIAPFTTLKPVDQAISGNPSTYFGPNSGGSILARQLLYDSPALTNFGSVANCDSTGNSVMNFAAAAANSLLDGSGTRPVLAAGMQYGTLTTAHSETVHSGPLSQPVKTVFNVGISPHTLDPAWQQPFMTMFVSRLALENCNLQPYSGLLGILEGQQTLPQDVGSLALDAVPTPGDLGLTDPLDYQ